MDCRSATPYQFTPHDLHDWDATETPMLVDLKYHGEPRKVLLQGNRNGFFGSTPKSVMAVEAL
jgi:glucose dehydrogenase